MLPDPTPISSVDWSGIGRLLHYLWFYLAIVVAFGVTMLTAHAVIPSMVSTGHLPRTAGLLRFSLTIAGLILLAMALTLLSYTVNLARLVGNFYDRYWI